MEHRRQCVRPPKMQPEFAGLVQDAPLSPRQRRHEFRVGPSEVRGARIGCTEDGVDEVIALFGKVNDPVCRIILKDVAGPLWLQRVNMRAYGGERETEFTHTLTPDRFEFDKGLRRIASRSERH